MSLFEAAFVDTSCSLKFRIPYSLQRDCGLVSRIGSQGSVATTHGPHMERARTVVMAGDTCHDGAVHMPVLHQAMALHSVSSGFRAIAFLPTRPHLYTASFFTPGLCRSDMGVFLSARDENVHVQASIWWWPWRRDSPITTATTYVIFTPSCMCVMCVCFRLCEH